MSDIHTYPLDDYREHDINPACWCHPTEVEPGLWIHHSLDGRELVEEGKRLVQ